MITYQHKESGVVYGFMGYTSDGFVGLQAGNDKHCLPMEDFKAWYRRFEPKCGDLLESENFVIKFYHFLGDNYESFLGQIMQCKSGGKIEGVDTFTTEFFRTMSKDKADKITEKLDKLNNLDQKENYDFVNPEHYKQGSMEVIDMMKLLWGTEALILHCEMSEFKYRMRLGRKPDQPTDRDLQKAIWYQEKAKKLRDELR
jgi:hypothetical protein